MGALTMRLAGAEDVPEVLGLLNERAAWLAEIGTGQWPGGFGEERIGGIVARGGTFLAEVDGLPAGTITASPEGDADFWTPVELLEPSWYVSKMAVARECAGRDLGGWMLRWVVDQAAASGVTWVRLDAWRTNLRLHQWYSDHGWGHLRIACADHRRSGALFQRAAAADPAARAHFTAPQASEPSCFAGLRQR